MNSSGPNIAHGPAEIRLSVITVPEKKVTSECSDPLGLTIGLWVAFMVCAGLLILFTKLGLGKSSIIAFPLLGCYFVPVIMYRRVVKRKLDHAPAVATILVTGFPVALLLFLTGQFTLMREYISRLPYPAISELWTSARTQATTIFESLQLLLIEGCHAQTTDVIVLGGIIVALGVLMFTSQQEERPRKPAERA